MESNDLKYAIEGLLFASERPLTVGQIQEAFDENISADDIRGQIAALKEDYETQGRGFKLFEIAGGYQLATDPRFEAYLKRLYQSRMKKRLSQATLETLSIIAYKQPVTRADIEFVRGVNIDAALKTLMEKGLVKIAGKKEVPGRPLLYATTELFLEHFGLNSVKDLPSLTQYTEKDIEDHLLPPEMNPALAETKSQVGKSGMSPALAEAKNQVEQGRGEALVDGEQKPIGCANEPDDAAQPEKNA